MIDDAWAIVAARWHVEHAGGIDAEQPVVSRAIEVNQHRGELRRVGVGIAAAALPLGSQRVEALVPHLHVALAAAHRVIARQLLEVGNDLVERGADAPVTTDEIGIGVAEYGAMAVDSAATGQVEEHRAAAEERLEVGADLV